MRSSCIRSTSGSRRRTFAPSASTRACCPPTMRSRGKTSGSTTRCGISKRRRAIGRRSISSSTTRQLRPFTESPEAELAEFEKTDTSSGPPISAAWRATRSQEHLRRDRHLVRQFMRESSAIRRGVHRSTREHDGGRSRGVRIRFGRYGSPQWQIEALRRLEIPDDMMAKNKWKTKLGGADSAIKRKILGENSARLYNYRCRQRSGRSPAIRSR